MPPQVFQWHQGYGIHIEAHGSTSEGVQGIHEGNIYFRLSATAISEGTNSRLKGSGDLKEYLSRADLVTLHSHVSGLASAQNLKALGMLKELRVRGARWSNHFQSALDKSTSMAVNTPADVTRSPEDENVFLISYTAGGAKSKKECRSQCCVNLATTVVHRGDEYCIPTCTCGYWMSTFRICSCIVKALMAAKKEVAKVENAHPIHLASRHPLWPRALKLLSVEDYPESRRHPSASNANEAAAGGSSSTDEHRPVASKLYDTIEYPGAQRHRAAHLHSLFEEMKVFALNGKPEYKLAVARLMELKSEVQGIKDGSTGRGMLVQPPIQLKGSKTTADDLINHSPLCHTSGGGTKVKPPPTKKKKMKPAKRKQSVATSSSAPTEAPSSANGGQNKRAKPLAPVASAAGSADPSPALGGVVGVVGVAPATGVDQTVDVDTAGIDGATVAASGSSVQAIEVDKSDSGSDDDVVILADGATAAAAGSSAYQANDDDDEDDYEVPLSDLPKLASKGASKEEEELSKIRTLAEIGKRIPIRADGNCGFAACRRGLGEESLSMNEFLKGLYDYAVDHHLEFCGGPRFHTTTGELSFNHCDPLRVFSGEDSVADYRVDYKPNRIETLAKKSEKPRSWFSSNRSKMRLERFKVRIGMIWKEGIDDLDLEDGCSSEFYFDTNVVLCIMALKYQRTFVVYQRGEDKAMSVAKYLSENGGSVSYHLHLGEWRSPPKDSVCIVHDGRIHYEYLQLKPSL